MDADPQMSGERLMWSLTDITRVFAKKPQPQPEERQIRYISIESDGYDTTFKDDEGRRIIVASAKVDIEPGFVRADLSLVAPRISIAGVKPFIRHVCEECGLDHRCEAKR